MKRYRIVYTSSAKQDVEQLYFIIVQQYKAPATAFNYVQGLYREIKKLSSGAESYTVQTRKSLQQFNPAPRRLNYKRMTVIYNVIDDTVYIRRIIPANTIAGL